MNAIKYTITLCDTEKLSTQRRPFEKTDIYNINTTIKKRKESYNINTIHITEHQQKKQKTSLSIKKTVRLNHAETLRELSKEIMQYLCQVENMETLRMLTPEGTYIIQGRTRSADIKKWIGMDKRITIMLKAETDELAIMEISHPAWKDKLAVMAISLVGLWPLFVCAAAGLVCQIRLIVCMSKIR